MRIEEDVKLDFKDVLIRPKRSTLASRKEVDIKRPYKFKWSERQFDGVPIIAANMDGVGTIAMAKAFAAEGSGLSVALHKHYPLEDLLAFYKEYGNRNAWYSIGVSERDVEKLDESLRSVLQDGDLVLTMGAGSIGRIASQLKESLEARG